jgi:hypothetical protein
MFAWDKVAALAGAAVGLVAALWTIPIAIGAVAAWLGVSADEAGDMDTAFRDAEEAGTILHQTTGGLADRTGELAEQEEYATRALTAHREETDLYNVSAIRLHDQIGATKDGLKLLAGAHAEAEVAAEDQAAALDLLRLQAHDTEGQILALEDAEWRLIDAEREYLAAVEEHGPKSEEAERADLRRRQAAHDLETQTNETADALRQMPGASPSVTDSWLAQFQKIGYSADTAARKVADLKRNLSTIPGSTTAVSPDVVQRQLTKPPPEAHSGGYIGAGGLAVVEKGEYVLQASAVAALNEGRPEAIAASGPSYSVTVYADSMADERRIADTVEKSLSRIVRSAEIAR